MVFFLIYLFYLFIFGCTGSSLLLAGFLKLQRAGATLHCGARASHCRGFSLRWLLLLRSTGSRHVGFSSCSTRAQQLRLAGSRAQAQQLWCTGPAAPRHVGSSRTRAWTNVPCIGRRALNHCTTREALYAKEFEKILSISQKYLRLFRSPLFINIDVVSTPASSCALIVIQGIIIPTLHIFKLNALSMFIANV